MKYQAVLGFVALLFAIGCGSSDKPPGLAADPPSGGAGGSGGIRNPGGKGGTAAKGGSSGDSDAGDAGGDGGAGGVEGGVNDSLSPDVTITSPAAAASPAGPVLIDDGVSVVNDAVKVICTAVGSQSAGAAPVDKSTVQLEMLDAAGASLKVLPGVPTGTDDEYSATFNVSENGPPPIPNGKISFVCRASDSARPAHPGVDRVDTFVDHGPQIQPGHPIPNSAHPLQGAVDFDFTVTRAPLAPGDTGDAVVASTVTLAVNDVPIDLSTAADATMPGHYKLSIDLTDATLFHPPPNGSTGVTIKAKDQRGALQQVTYYFVVDSLGPVIAITSPGPGDIIGGKRSLVFTVTDQQGGAGVDSKSVIVTVNGTDHPYNDEPLRWTEDKGTYTYTLDSTAVPVITAQFTVNIRAQDLAGNDAAGASAFYYIDSQPPVIDLDPLDVQDQTISGGGPVCSDPFDPLGPHPAPLDPPNGSAVNDLDKIPATAVFRALVWDETNHAPGAQVSYFSRVDPASVRLYAQPDPSAGLLVDTNPSDADPTCDDIDPALLSVLPFVQMYAVQPAGTAVSTGIGASPPTCTALTPNNPDKLCSKTSDLTRVIAHSLLPGGAAPEPVIYTLAMKGVCRGDEWTLSTDATSGVVKQNGWICLAVRASDGVGNFGVSRPLRVCLDNPALGATPNCDPTFAPTCVTSCTPPPRVDKGIIVNPP